MEKGQFLNLKVGDEIVYISVSANHFTYGKTYKVKGFKHYGYDIIVINDEGDECKLNLASVLNFYKLSQSEVSKEDNVNHPKHYTSHPSGIEAIEITRHYPFAIGNAIKYLWRAGLKKDASLEDKQKEIEDLEKAVWYIKDRIKQLKGNDREGI